MLTPHIYYFQQDLTALLLGYLLKFPFYLLFFSLLVWWYIKSKIARSVLSSWQTAYYKSSIFIFKKKLLTLSFSSADDNVYRFSLLSCNQPNSWITVEDIKFKCEIHALYDTRINVISCILIMAKQYSMFLIIYELSSYSIYTSLLSQMICLDSL